MPIPNRRVALKYSLGQILALKYFEIEMREKIKESEKEKVLELK